MIRYDRSICANSNFTSRLNFHNNYLRIEDLRDAYHPESIFSSTFRKKWYRILAFNIQIAVWSLVGESSLGGRKTKQKTLEICTNYAFFDLSVSVWTCTWVISFQFTLIIYFRPSIISIPSSMLAQLRHTARDVAQRVFCFSHLGAVHSMVTKYTKHILLIRRMQISAFGIQMREMRIEHTPIVQSTVMLMQLCAWNRQECMQSALC